MTDEQIAKQLLKQYKKEDTGILLTPDVASQFIALFREAVVDFFPKFVEKHKGQTIYGVSFEIGNLVQFVYEEDFETYLYFNTEEEYRNKSKTARKMKNRITASSLMPSGTWFPPILRHSKSCKNF